ncbi:ComEA family DNA-binding protein [Pseudoxanthomonas putridarboris]|uniref:ComEA family DNA-binding protein n=1 Tax=Pseudoxanthomonas putridarboris TaxID=752605 RepID=A0ABU9IYE0_9GAMM
MKSFVHIAQAAVLSLLLAFSALATEKVNINTADAATLDRVLVGVGPSKAAAIVEYRKANGPFKSAEELAMVKGIGLRTVELNRDRIELRSAAAPAPKPATATGTEKPNQAARR